MNPQSPGAVPVVSVITPAYNAAATLEETIASVEAQTFGEWELIVIDDQSSDDTATIVERHATDPRVRLVRAEQRLGYCGARNVGVRAARGRYLAFLDADDVWLPEKLAVQLQYHANHPWCRVSHTAYEVFWDGGAVLRRTAIRWLDLLHKRRGRLLPVLYIRNVIGMLTVVLERDLFEEAGGFDESNLACEDQDLWIRIAELGHRFGYVNRKVARYRRSPSATSYIPGKWERAWWELYQRRVAHNPRVSSRIRREAAAFFYAHYGLERLRKGELAEARGYFRNALRSHPLGLSGFASAWWWVKSHVSQAAGQRGPDPTARKLD